jgi:Cofactor assembly of complex C subunit B, CCB2/CCB4
MTERSAVLLRNLPIFVGLLGSSLLVINRFVTANPEPAQTRSDALGLALSAVLVLVGLLWQQVVPDPPVASPLSGSERYEVADERFGQDFALLKNCLLQQTRAASLLVWYQGTVLLRAGIFPEVSDFTPSTIVQRVMSTRKTVYLVDLNLFPGRTEFACLPKETRALVCQGIGQAGILLVGSAYPRSFSPQELAWIEILAIHLEEIFTSSTNPKSY